MEKTTTRSKNLEERKNPTSKHMVNAMASLVAQMVKNLPAMWETQIRSLVQEGPLEKERATHTSTLAWRIHGQRNLVGYSPWGYKESDMTEGAEHTWIST